MKKLFLLVVVVMTALCVNAQVKIETPHPDIDIQIKRCAYANKTLVIDMLITNYAPDATINFYGSACLAPSTMAVDDEGNQYTKGEKILVGTAGDLSFWDKSIMFMQDVPTKFRVQINDVDPNATKLSILKVSGISMALGMSNSKNPIVIKNLEWSK